VKPPPSLSKKITVGYYLVAAMVALAALLTWHELASLEHKVRLGEQTTELQDIVLEIRRFERNFFLHRQPADLRENRSMLGHANAYLKTHRAAFAAIETPATLARLQALLATYAQRMTGYAATPAADARGLDEAEQAVRETGREIIAIAGDITQTERRVVQATLQRFRLLLVIGILVMGTLVVLLSRGIARRIVSPLKAMESRVDNLSRVKTGRMAPPTDDSEIVSVTNAVNHMLGELEARQHHLVRSEKLASLGTLLAGVAHELNNPLSNISTSCQILLEEWDETDDRERRNYLQQIDAQCNRARDIVNALLDFARPRDFRWQRVPLRQLVLQTLQFMRGDLAAGVTAQCDIEEAVAVAGDPQRLQQVLINLLKNAAQAVGGEGTIVVSSHAATVRAGDESSQSPFGGCPLSGDVIDITVTDSGPGIAPEVVTRVFDPFFTTKDVGKGMGLGLFVSHEIVEQHDGCIAVTTGEHGTTFHVRLPAATQLPHYLNAASPAQS
jgi:two-component system NtrC family sensor kinase